MNWITAAKKIGIKVKKIFKKQPVGQQETDWKNCPQCKKISYLPDLISNSYICQCNFHFDLPPRMRLESLFDSDYELIELEEDINPLSLPKDRNFSFLLLKISSLDKLENSLRLFSIEFFTLFKIKFLSLCAPPTGS